MRLRKSSLRCSTDSSPLKASCREVRVEEEPTVCRCFTLEESRRNFTCLRPAKAKESTILMGLSLMTSMEMCSEPAKAYPSMVWILVVVGGGGGGEGGLRERGE